LGQELSLRLFEEGVGDDEGSEDDRNHGHELNEDI
jgi:hypothetical protein